MMKEEFGSEVDRGCGQVGGLRNTDQSKSWPCLCAVAPSNQRNNFMDEVIHRSSRKARQLYFPRYREIHINSERKVILLLAFLFCTAFRKSVPRHRSQVLAGGLVLNKKLENDDNTIFNVLFGNFEKILKQINLFWSLISIPSRYFCSVFSLIYFPNQYTIRKTSYNKNV